MTIDDEVLYKKYNLDMEIYRGVPIDFDTLKIRTANCLKMAGIYVLDQLLSSTYNNLSEIRNLGMLSLKDIEEYIKSLDGKDINRTSVTGNSRISAKILKFRKQIFEGAFDEEMYIGLDEIESSVMDNFREGYRLIENDLVKLCREKPDVAFSVSQMLNLFVRQIEKNTKFDGLFDAIKEKSQNPLKSYFDIYPLKDELSDEFKDFSTNENVTLGTLFVKTATNGIFVDEKTKFIKWASFDLRKELESFLEGIYARSANAERVLELRAKKYTLQVIGDELGLTRERVRQIEKKVVQPFCRWQREKKFLPRLSADFRGETILEATDLQEYFGDVTEVLLYLLQCADDEYFSYDRETDTVIIVDDDITDFARDYVEKMPDSLDESRIEEFKKKAIDEYSIPEDIFYREVSAQYNISGNYYHRSKLSLEKMYMIVLAKYYPDGMNVYKEEELERFRHLIINEFGDVSLPQKNRAISAAIGRCCILCGRGKYRVKDQSKMPHQLITRVYHYIMNSEKSLFFLNEIFLEFEQELRDAGIDNRFFLQGVLREEYDGELFFRRDYVSKDSNNLSLDRDIKLFIKRSKYPVTKAQIREEFPGITEIMLSLAVADDDIINYRGSYLHSSNLNLHDYDKTYITNIVECVTGDGMPHHCNEIYDVMLNDNPDMLNRLGIYYQYSLYSLLQYMFGDYYQFERPYIAHEGVSINKPMELMEEYVAANDVLEVTELLELAKEYHYTIYDILKFLNSWNGTHLLISKQEMASTEYIGITEDIVSAVEALILDEIGEQALVTELRCIYKLPKINVAWNEWLIYSVVNRFSSQLEAHTTYSQFRSASPVVSRIGMFNREAYEGDNSGQMTQTVDLNDMDAIDHYIMEDFEIEW